MLTTIVVICLFVVAFFMVLGKEWATGLWVMLLIATLITWCVTLYQEHIKQKSNVKTYERVYNLSWYSGCQLLRQLFLEQYGFWLDLFLPTKQECNSSSSSCFMKLLQKCVFYLHHVLTFATFCYKIL